MLRAEPRTARLPARTLVYASSDPTRAVIQAAMLRLTIAARTDRGLQRSNNEDALLIVNLDAQERCEDVADWHVGHRGVLLAVSDGLGGARAGEVASEMSVEAVFEELRLERRAGDLDRMLQRAVARASRRVCEAGRTRERQGMGATLTAALIEGTTAHVVQVGDSRAYLLRGGELRQITHDQSYVQTLLDEGSITKEDAERSPLRNIVSQVMGQDEEVRADLGRLVLRAGDRLLLCSDGLSNALDESQILRGAAEAEVASACERLIEAANAAGGPDNITVVLAAVAPR